MRRIEVQPNLTIRFSQRNADFDEGVEIGIAVGLMATGQQSFERWLSREAVEQVRAVAAKLGYRIVVEGSDGDVQRIVACRNDLRPRLKIVAS